MSVNQLCRVAYLDSRPICYSVHQLVFSVNYKSSIGWSFISLVSQSWLKSQSIIQLASHLPFVSHTVGQSPTLIINVSHFYLAILFLRLTVTAYQSFS